MYTEEQLQDIVARILKKGFAKKAGFNIVTEATNDENAFFVELIKQALEAKLDPLLFDFEPMSTKSFSVRYNNIYVGRIEIREYSYMQILTGLFGVKEEYCSSLEGYVSHIPEWIKYIEYCLDYRKSVFDRALNGPLFDE